MKHLPNLLTLGNLICGCLAVAYIFTAQPYIYQTYEGGGFQAHWVPGFEQMYLGSIFIAIAAVFDMLDGFAARLLNVYSPIGKDLDSLADMVSFGVAPSAIVYKLLWDAMMCEKDAMDINILAMAPAFLIACFAALRLAKFNITTAQQKSHFIGVPTPAVGLFIASIPLVQWYNPFHVSDILQNKWVIYGIIALMCYLMVSKIKFMKLTAGGKGFKGMWPQITLVVITLASVPFLWVLAIPLGFVLYILLSLVAKYPEEA